MLIYRMLIFPVMVAMALSLVIANAALAAQTRPPANGCVEVDVNGQRAASLSCLGEKMAAPQQPAAAKRQQAAGGLDIGTAQPNSLGQFTQSGLRNRMGNTLGQSIKPQRPPRE